MASDLTPEEQLRACASIAYGEKIPTVALTEALAAVAAERERLGERLLSDEAVKEAGTAGAALSAAWRVVTGSNHE